MTSIEAAYSKFCTTRFPLPSEKDLSAIEGLIKRKLPRHYWDYLLNFNGGVFSDPIIDLSEIDSQVTDGLSLMYGVNAPVDACELARGPLLAVFNLLETIDVLPIGWTPVGNAILLDVEEGAETYGTVWFKATDNHWRYPGKWIPMAESMEGFFGFLHESS